LRKTLHHSPRQNGSDQDFHLKGRFVSQTRQMHGNPPMFRPSEIFGEDFRAKPQRK
jgi:hypothetical protein